jgi:uncharacterized protein YrrD
MEYWSACCAGCKDALNWAAVDFKERRDKMINVELKEGTGVFTSGGKEVGRISRFILDPATNEVTHIVVQKGWLLTEDKVVPFEMVESATEDKVVLNETRDNFNELPPFEETHFVRLSDEAVHPTGYANDRTVPGYYWYPPHGYIGYPAYGLGYGAWPPMETTQNIPEGTVPLKEGTDVISSDGEHVGDIERLLVESDSNRATHFLITQGVLFKDRKLVPSQWVKSIEDDKVHLSVSSKFLENLPPYES